MINSKSNLIFLTTLFFLVFSNHSSGQDFLKTNGKAIVSAVSGDTVILRGMGLGGWMLQEGYMLQTASFANAQYEIKGKIEELIGETNTNIFYEKWLENHVRKIDIDSLAAWGFNSVRLPMHYNLYTLPIENEPIAGENTWLDKGFIMTDSLISWCKANNMWVILDLHAAPGGQGYDAGISDYDPTKPSLWESTANQAKTVALWKRLAERYVDEPAIAGYDLINEVNWNIPGGVQLRNLYGQITDSIRSVDQNHIIFIEGNWFANDFTGLTPPWDDNMVYSPHKYWSTNDQASIQWVLDMRDQYDIPLYLGESGENSNVWFRDAIRLLEDNDIGWAWWPMKKIESIAGPLSVEKTAGYKNLLSYWEGNANAPTAAEATNILMDVTEKLKLENCFYQKDVIDAMFRQVYSDEALPFSPNEIPGTIYATEYNLGSSGIVCFEAQDANYHVSTGNYTAWNNGWAFRNDGVDIEPNIDVFYSNGFSVGWTETGEWIEYDVNISEAAVYDINLRIANGSTDGAMHFSIDGADLSLPFYVPNTGSYQSWETITIPNVVLTPDDKRLRLHVDEGGFNISSFTFSDVLAIEDLTTDFFSAKTLDDNTVELTLNKPLTPDFINLTAGFEIFVNGNQVILTSVIPDAQNARSVNLTLDETLKSTDIIKISYTGNMVSAVDGTSLNNFIQKTVQNTLAIVHNVPGRIEAEEYFFQSGIQLENTQDVGGGQNVGYLDADDYMDYVIDVAATGEYQVDYRTAGESGNGIIQLQLIDDFGNEEILHSILLPPTGGFQTWETNSKTVDLEEGRHHIRLKIIQAPFNLNWFEFTDLTSVNNLASNFNLQLFPNPTMDVFYFNGNWKNNQDVRIEIFDLFGQKIIEKKFENISSINETFNVENFPTGVYFVKFYSEKEEIQSFKIIKNKE